MSELTTDIDPVGTRHLPTDAANALERDSALSWKAIFAGAVGAAALSLMLLILGTGLGLSTVSPWSMEGITATSFGLATIAWLTFTQLAASGMGGYLAGRLRTKWTGVHTDEVYFRDTAHGFLSWAVASLLVVVVLTSAVGSIVSGGVRAGAAVAGGTTSAVGAVAGATDSDQITSSIEYFVDSLFRGTPNGDTETEIPEARSNTTEGAQSGEANTDGQAGESQVGSSSMAQQLRGLASEVSQVPTGQIVRIFAQALSTGTLPEADKRYVGQQIAQRSDLTQEEAEQNVADGFEDIQTTLKEAETTAREAVDEAREATAYAALWVFVSLLVGAFFASLMAVFGGRQRDA